MILKYTAEDSIRAESEWKATCGPHSIAAACGLTLDQVRPFISNYKGWMSPMQMADTLRSLGKFKSCKTPLKTSVLCNGINRIQWEGKWLDPGVPVRIAYFHTHWVAHFDGLVLCTACEPTKIIKEEDWRDFLLNSEPKSPFHITHHYELWT